MRRRTLLHTTLAIVLAACGVTAGEPEPKPLTVFAAASLTGAFRALGAAYEAARPDVRLAFNFAGSAALLQQIGEGAAADVFAAADEPTMQKAMEGGHVKDEPRVFARNALQIVVGKGNPRHITGLADLTRPDLVVVLCGDTVPCGRYALSAFDKAHVRVPEGSRELDVKAVVGKVALGEADAGLAYATDVRAASDRIEGVDLAPDQNVTARYPIAVLRESAQPDAARAFVAFVSSDTGRKILGGFGFLNP